VATLSDAALKRAEYTLAGLDLLLHRIGWSAQIPARQVTERNEAAIAAWREETWPVVQDGGGSGRLALLRRRVRPGLKAAQGDASGAAAATPRWLKVTGASNSPYFHL